MCRSDRDKWWAGGIFAPFLWLRNFFSPVVRASVARGSEKNRWRAPTVTPSSFTVEYKELHQQA